MSLDCYSWLGPTGLNPGNLLGAFSSQGSMIPLKAVRPLYPFPITILVSP